MLCVLNVVLACIRWASNLILVFFFKQKTAYEVRISDWSSDVCSSDLVSWRGLRPVWKSAGQERRRRRCGASASRRDAAGGLPDATRKIGRAPWRERVCQYV